MVRTEPEYLRKIAAGQILIHRPISVKCETTQSKFIPSEAQANDLTAEQAPVSNFTQPAPQPGMKRRGY